MALSGKITADVVIAGAGIMGAACAYRLSAQGLKVVLLESQPAPAMGSTGLSAAGVRVQFTEEVNIRISWESIQEYRAFEELYGEDAGYKPAGYLFLVSPERAEVHLASVALQTSLGAPVQVLSLEEARAIVDFNPEGIAVATYGPADGVIDPHRITLTYLRKARENGASFYSDSPLTKAQFTSGAWQVETPGGVVEAPYLVNAAGSWAGEVAERAGLQVPVYPVRRMIFLTAPTSWEHHYPLAVDADTNFYLRSEGPRILFGCANPEEKPGFTTGIDWNWFDNTIAAGVERFPWLANTKLDRKAAWYGYYEVTPDHNAILGRMPGVENWINVAGFSGHGVQQAPVVSRLIAEEIIQGKAHSIDIDPLRIERFANVSVKQEHEYNIV